MQIRSRGPDPIQWPGLIDSLRTDNRIGRITESAPLNSLLRREPLRVEKFLRHAARHYLDPLFSGDAPFSQITRIGCTIHEINGLMWIGAHEILLHVFDYQELLPLAVLPPILRLGRF